MTKSDIKKSSPTFKSKGKGKGKGKGKKSSKIPCKNKVSCKDGCYYGCEKKGVVEIISKELFVCNPCYEEYKDLFPNDTATHRWFPCREPGCVRRSNYGLENNFVPIFCMKHAESNQHNYSENLISYRANRNKSSTEQPNVVMTVVNNVAVDVDTDGIQAINIRQTGVMTRSKDYLQMDNIQLYTHLLTLAKQNDEEGLYDQNILLELDRVARILGVNNRIYT